MLPPEIARSFRSRSHAPRNAPFALAGFVAFWIFGCGTPGAPQTSSSSNWLVCGSDADCTSFVPDSYCGKDGFCESGAGRHVEGHVVLDDEFDETAPGAQLFA